MDWIERLNQVMDYVEDHLDGSIDESEISRIMAAPFPLFQGSFSQIAGVPFSEYVRRRKLASAARELQGSNARVIDLALKYGYQSEDAFRVAFKRLHGVTPGEAREPGQTLTFYCRLSFALTVKGVDQMDYAILKREPFKVIGIRRTTPYGGGTWAVVKSDGSSQAIQKLSGRFFDLGLCFGFQEDGSNDYMCAVEWEGDDVPGFESYTYPAASWLRFDAKGLISDQVLGSAWQRINKEFLPQSGYQKCGLPTIEKYITWDEAADACHVEIWIPYEYG